jgi:hypothetical protein
MKYSVLELNTKATEAWAEGRSICVRLDDQREIRFPASENRHLAAGTDRQIGNIEIICGGTGLHWPDLDEDLSVIGILEGRLGQESR